ncbi:hypothetical protein BJ912DRAFT_557947 [Pholiota molesta]|nr:hypothetical protein BJ912DRAFT_557947 [Pholiota molesta]
MHRALDPAGVVLTAFCSILSAQQKRQSWTMSVRNHRIWVGTEICPDVRLNLGVCFVVSIPRSYDIVLIAFVCRTLSVKLRAINSGISCPKRSICHRGSELSLNSEIRKTWRYRSSIQTGDLLQAVPSLWETPWFKPM